MGYNLHITRKQNWYDEGNDISIEEWGNYVRGDQEMRMDNFAEAKTTDGNVIRTEEKGLAVWIAYNEQAWLSYSRGNIEAKNPDKEIIKKLISIAKVLKARVVGDEGEEYAETLHVPSIKRKPWWSIW